MRFAILGASSFSGTGFCKHLKSIGESYVELNRPRFDLNKSTDEMADEIERNKTPYVVNFMALNMVAESWKYAADYYQTNVVGMARLVDRLKDFDFIQKFVQVSTPEVYGTTETFLKEDARFNPSTPYAVSRAACDMNLNAYFKAYGFPVCFTRTVNVYGPGQQLYRIIPKTALCILSGKKLQLHGGGLSTRSFIHIKDVAMAQYLIAIDGVPGETYHAATEEQTSIRDLVEMICRRMGARFEDVVEEAPERTGKDRAYQLDDAKLRAMGWGDTERIERGVYETVDWVSGDFERLNNHSSEYAHRP